MKTHSLIEMRKFNEKNSGVINPKILSMSLEEKASLMSGANFWNTKSIDRLDIPSIMLTDGPHGLRKQGGKADHLGLNKSQPATCFPTAASLANSWDNQLLYQVGRGLGIEAAGENVSVLLGPGLNIKRNPLCGRNFEYFSEDPYLSGTLSAAMIQGIQSQGVAACPKHFAVNSQELHRMSVDEIVDDRALYELYLEGFRIAVEEGKAQAIMTSYNKVNGIYANENQDLLMNNLRNDWNFKGLVVTDWGGNNDRVEALKAGNHLEMPSTNEMTDRDIVNAVKLGKLEESVLDERVSEFLEFVDSVSISKDVKVEYDKQHALAEKAAAESIVLLKNKDGLLPLNRETKIAFIGDFVKVPRYQGAGSSLINPTQVVSLYDALEASIYNNVTYAQGFDRFGKESSKLVKDALLVASSAEVVVLYLGLDESRESEGVDRKDMKLAQNQINLVASLKELGKPIVLVLAGGSPVELPFWDDISAAVHTYLPGQAGGEALLKVLTGVVNPSGKLAETYPLVYEDVASSQYYPGLEVTSEHRESIYIGYRYFAAIQQDVRFPFGYGLSYTEFEYSNMKYDNNKVHVTITNTGTVAGAEVVQTYVSMKESKTFRSSSELAGYSKVYLEAGESKVVVMDLRSHAFKVYDPIRKGWIIETGDYHISVASHSRDMKETITITLDGVEYSDVDKVKLEPYLTHEFRNLTAKDFEGLYGKLLPNPLWDRNKVLDMNDIVEQSRYTSNFGRFINWTIDKMSDFYMWRKKPNASNNMRFAQNLPYRGIARMSNGFMNMAMMNGLIEMSNGKFFKGSWRMIIGKIKGK